MLTRCLNIVSLLWGRRMRIRSEEELKVQTNPLSREHSPLGEVPITVHLAGLQFYKFGLTPPTPTPRPPGRNFYTLFSTFSLTTWACFLFVQIIIMFFLVCSCLVKRETSRMVIFTPMVSVLCLWAMATAGTTNRPLIVCYNVFTKTFECIL